MAVVRSILPPKFRLELFRTPNRSLNCGGDIVGAVAKLDSNYGFASIRVSSYPSLVLKKRATISTGAVNWAGGLANTITAGTHGCGGF